MNEALVNSAIWIGTFAGLIAFVIAVAPREQLGHQPAASNPETLIGLYRLRRLVGGLALVDRVFGARIVSLSLLWAPIALFSFSLLCVFLLDWRTFANGLISPADLVEGLYVNPQANITWLLSICLSFMLTRSFLRLAQRSPVILLPFLLVLDYFLSCTIQTVSELIVSLITEPFNFMNHAVLMLLSLLFLVMSPKHIIGTFLSPFSMIHVQYSSSLEGSVLHPSLYGLYFTLSATNIACVLLSLWIWLFALGGLMMRGLFLIPNIGRFFGRLAERRRWFLTVPAVLTLVVVCLAGLPIVISGSLE